ncbi:MAG: polyprenyl synthetase family protein [Candidatus Riflebacteria bacterium]|nr:polyprenyl synthetase family protein [Candidatus Riflebacteria bacterium]
MVKGDPEFVTTLAAYVLEQRGQLLRPTLVLGCSLLRGATSCSATAISAGALVELIHCASLLHDDVVDMASFRRQRATVNARWGNREAVLLGDYVLALVVQLLAELGDRKVLAAGHRITRAMSVGELIEVQHATRLDLNEETYLEIISGKTASLFAESCYLGGWAAGLPDVELDHLSGFGHGVGMVYQILDDLLDVTGSADRLGKDTARDMANGNITLPVIRALVTGSVDLRRHLERALTDGDESFIRENLASIVVGSGAYHYCLARAREYAESAAGRLASLSTGCPASIVKALGEVTGYMFERLEAGGGVKGAATRTAAL